MTKEEFENCLDSIAYRLREEARKTPFSTAKQFEQRVREITKETIKAPGIYNPPPQAFPDIAIGEFGIEVKFTEKDEWRSVANSILETNRIKRVKHVYIMFGKMGGTPDVRWGDYEKCIIHVRTSHVPRFEVLIGAEKSLFDVMNISYEKFRALEIHDKMKYIRDYARKRLKKGERLWWLEDTAGNAHTLPIQARLFTELEQSEKVRLRAEAILLCPQIVQSGRARHKYDDVALFMLTYHGVICHQARDMFSAGSVGNPNNDDNGGLYIARMLKLMEKELEKAASRMDAALFKEYWGEDAPSEPEKIIEEWLRLADDYAAGRWKPSEELFGGKYAKEILNRAESDMQCKTPGAQRPRKRAKQVSGKPHLKEIGE